MNKTLTSDVVNQSKQHVWHHLTQHKAFETSDPLIINEGQGMYLKDIHGNEYLDMTSGGVWTVNVGYGRKKIVDAIYEQLLKMPYYSGCVGNVPGAQFASRLIEKMPGLSRVYYSNSGSEANEKAFKIVRQIAEKKYGGKKYKILFRERDYHGTTITALSATGQLERKKHYGPFTPGFVEVPHCLEYRSQWGDVDDYGIRAANEIERVILEEGPDTVGALCLEPITAGGGIIMPPKGYWERVQEICKKYDVLLHIDEVVCGLGRTGKWFAYQHFNVKPDIVTMAKGVASGYAAISCTITTEEIFGIFKEDNSRDGYFRDISTFGGCTAGPAGALATMDIIEEEKLLENIQQVGAYLQDQLMGLKDKHEIIGDVRGIGFLAGLELVENRQTKQPVPEETAAKIAGHCLQNNGILIGRTNRSFKEYNNTIILSPAFICGKKEIDQIVSALDQALTACV